MICTHRSPVEFGPEESNRMEIYAHQNNQEGVGMLDEKESSSSASERSLKPMLDVLESVSALP